MESCAPKRAQRGLVWSSLLIEAPTTYTWQKSQVVPFIRSRLCPTIFYELALRRI